MNTNAVSPFVQRSRRAARLRAGDSAWRSAALWLVATVAAFLAPSVMPSIVGWLGAEAAALLWLPFAIFALSALVGLLPSRTASAQQGIIGLRWALALLARLALLALIVRAVMSSQNDVAGALTSIAQVGLFGLVFLFVMFGLLFGLKLAARNEGAAIGELVGAVGVALLHAARMILVPMVIFLVGALVLMLAHGRRGWGYIGQPQAAPDPGSRLLGGRVRYLYADMGSALSFMPKLTFGGVRLPSSSRISERRDANSTLYTDVAWLSFDPEHGRKERFWLVSDRERREAVREMASLTNGLIVAVDALIQAGQKTAIGYIISVVNAWHDSQVGRYGFVLEIKPSTVAVRAAELITEARLIPALEPHSDFSRADLLAHLKVGGRAAATDPVGVQKSGWRITYEAGEAIAAEPAATGGDQVLVAIQRGLREQHEPADLFVPVGAPERTYDKLTYRFRPSGAGSQTVKGRQKMEEVWKGLRPAIRYVARHADDAIQLSHDDESGLFQLALSVPPPPMAKPGDEAVSLRRFLVANRDEMARYPRRFCLGLDDQGTPYWVDLRRTPHALVVGASGSGKSVAGVLSPVVQLAAVNPPDRMKVWLLDGKAEIGRVLSKEGRLPHLDPSRIVRGTGDPRAIIALLSEFRDEVDRRNEAYEGAGWSPTTGDPWLLLVVEETQKIMADAALKDKKFRDEMEGLMNSILTTARSSGCHVILTAQKGTTDVLPSVITANTSVRVVGQSRADDYQAVLGVRNVALTEPGRVAVMIQGSGDYKVVQALADMDADIARRDPDADAVSPAMAQLAREIASGRGISR